MSSLNPIKIVVEETVSPEFYLKYCKEFNITPTQDGFLDWVKGISEDEYWEGIDMSEIAAAGWNTNYYIMASES